MEEKTILVVDDEEIIRDLLSKVLTKLGYKVVAAGDGRQAIEIYDQRHGEINMAIIDLSMPELDGRQTLTRLKEIDSGLIVFLSSGDIEEDAASLDSNLMADGFLIKPYRVDKLAEIIRDAFTAGRPAARQYPA